MTEFWRQLEGQVVDGRFPLRQYLAGGEDHAVFLTDHNAARAAIKVLPDSEHQLQQWTRAAKRSHPHLMHLFAMGRCQLDGVSLIYVVMEYAEEDLSQVIPQRPLTAQEAREMLEPLLSALAYLHAEGFVHRRLKPSNIMSVDGRLRISSDGAEIATAENTQAGDVWSLGMTLVEVLTQHRASVAPDTLPEPFGDIARQCLQQDPRNRWTVPVIAARLRPPRRWTYVWAAVLCLIMAAVLFGPKLFTRPTEPPPVVQPVVQPKPEKTVPPTPTQSAPPKSQASNGEVSHRVLPQVPSKALSTISGTVKVGVRVQVTPSGAVSSAKLDSPGPSKYFAQFALDAARHWRFAPAATSSEWVLRFEFTRTGVTVQPTRGAR